MKKNLSTILAAVSCLLVVICLFQISNLNQQINTFENNLSSQVSQIRNEVNAISSSIRTSLEEQASLLTDSSWEFGDADYDARTVELVCSISPKEYSSGTAATVLVGDTEHPMTLSNGAFTARVNIPLFEETKVAKVMFRDGDVTRTELLDWYLSPRYDYLLNAYASLDGSATGTPKDGIYHYHRDGVININVDSKETNGVTSITLVEVMDGKELDRTDIPLDNTDFFENYQNESGARPEPVYSPAPLDGGGVTGHFYCDLINDYEIPYGSTWMLYIESEDNNGLLYRNVIDRQVISSSGEPVDDSQWWFGLEASIYDADGNVLFTPDEELYQ